ncbi:hypothetical protein CLV24_13022 [Pontibacter ummariensis]|uniref:Lipoprotein n=1 Tax=Pontibacter ummariensis TaxID=1610492 RepID=A0A239KPA8_9BACT|nr:hypothetical protein [Pontibacter ummariensis]PRY05342.1 hypothetical protein CLV24_13022 [Pontibacter ummariensis]SNT19562.1 hypothetical protein SAMN06296052_13022 [Pontibacter ummariensis]
MNLKRRFTAIAIILLLIGQLSCTTESNSSSPIEDSVSSIKLTDSSVEKGETATSGRLPDKADTAYFTVAKAAKSIDQNTIRIEKTGTYRLGTYTLDIHDSPTKEEFYDLEIKQNGKSLFKTEAYDISKVVIDKSKVGFTIFDMVTEDNANVGYVYILDTVKAEVQKYPKPLQNTTNPIIIGERIFLTNGLAILETDKELKTIRERHILYSSAMAEDKYEYMDTYNIDELSRISNSLLINFTPHRSKEERKVFSGEIAKTADVILIKE